MLKPARLVVLFLLASVTLASGLVAAPRPALDPTRRPDLPTQPPPPLAAGPAAPVPGRAPGTVSQIASVPGWQVLSFPVGRLTAAQGFQRMLLMRGPEGLQAVDPVNNPGSVNPGLAYLAWFDQPAPVEFSGEPGESGSDSCTLYAGWNMIGCPSTKPTLREHISLTRAGGTSAGFHKVAGDSTTPGAAWLYSTAYTFSGGRWVPMDLRQPGVLTQPGGVALLFCWQEMELNWNHTAPAGGAPVLKSVTPGPLKPGQTVTVTGQNLGEPGRGALTVGAMPVQPENVVSWTPTKVQFKVPVGATSGDLHVQVDRFPGNSLPVTIAQPPAAPAAPSGGGGVAGGGTLEGQVFDSQGDALQGAQVLLDDGYKVITDARGSFRFDHLPAGTHKAYITLIGYKSASGEVTVQQGAARTLKVSLSPTSGNAGGARSPEKSGSFTVSAFPFNLGMEEKNKYWVYRIQVWEVGNYHKRWENTWWTNNGDARYDLNCPDALLGRSYAVVVTWRDQVGDERSNRWTQEVHKDGETFRYYDPIGAEGG